MRKIALILALIIGCYTEVNAQDESTHTVIPTWGIKAETNMSGFFVSGIPDVNSEMKVGATFGGFLNLELTKHFAIQGELLYHYKSSNLNRENIEGDFRYWGMEIPIYAMYQYKLNNGGRTYIGVGPYSEFGFSAKLKREGERIDLYDKNNESKIAAMHDFNSGFGILVGYEFTCGLQINAGYKISITNVLDANSSSLTLLPNTISLGIGYRFH